LSPEASGEAWTRQLSALESLPLLPEADFAKTKRPLRQPQTLTYKRCAPIGSPWPSYGWPRSGPAASSAFRRRKSWTTFWGRSDEAGRFSQRGD
jgi:hypothetical protein